MNRKIYFIIPFALLVALSFQVNQKGLSKSEGVADVLKNLGEDYSTKMPKTTIKGVSALVGEDIVKNGFSKRDNLSKSKRQSKHFVCTSCHNIRKEDPDLTKANPQARLEYTNAQNMPFLQGTTLYGAVNREKYYNGDYEKKYGALVEPARNDIRQAIQLCATECAQGRKLDDWELESVLAYLWKIQLTIEDLALSEPEIAKVAEALTNPELKADAKTIIKSKYLTYSPATFLLPPSDRKLGTGLKGNSANGKLIYENSCLHCHYQKQYSFLHLDSKPMSFRHLNSKADTYSNHSLYQVTRYGTYAKYGKRSYMPNYTAEKLSEQQLADLRAYIREQSES